MIPASTKAVLSRVGYSVEPSRSQTGQFRWWLTSVTSNTDGQSGPQRQVSTCAFPSEAAAWQDATYDSLLFSSPTWWAWILRMPGKRLAGHLKALDPRDALSRTLASTTQSGGLLGSENGIPIEILQAAPANFDDAHVSEGEGFRLEVRRFLLSVGHPDLALRPRQLRCTCCGGMFQGRQFANQDTGHGLGDCCVDYVLPREDEFERTFGVFEVHFCLSAA